MQASGFLQGARRCNACISSFIVEAAPWALANGPLVAALGIADGGPNARENRWRLVRSGGWNEVTRRIAGRRALRLEALGCDHVP